MRYMQLPAIMLALAGPVGAAETGTAPAEVPADDFSGAQYVDSNGCLFRRVDRLGGGLDWAPVVTPEGDLLCGFSPELAIRDAPAAASAAPPAPAAAAALPAQPARLRLVGIDVVPAAATSCPAGGAAQVARYFLSDGRVVLRCAGQAGDAADFLIAQGYLAKPPAAPGVPAGASFVQIGAFSGTANAAEAEALAMAMGLPVRRAKGKAVTLVAGPFDSPDDMRRVWQMLYAVGFRDILYR